MDFTHSLYDLPRILFSITFITLMTLGCFWVIRPFILGFTWAGMIVIATWPLLIRVQHLLWEQRSLAVLVMTLLLLLIFVVPISIMVTSIINNSASLVAWASQTDRFNFPNLIWLKDIPIVGYKIYKAWQTLLSSESTFLVIKIQPYIVKSASWMLEQIANLGSLLLQCSLMILFSIILYSRGECVGMAVRHFAIRLATESGDASVLLAVQAIRAVALGTVLTAIIQAILGGIGLVISGIPMSMMLTISMFILCIAQVGPLPILIPAIIWLYWNGDTTFGTILLVWSCIMITLDNLLRPIFIHMGADLPILLVLCGVLGGLLAFGMIGLFVGPVVLAVSWRLILAWIQASPLPKKQD